MENYINYFTYIPSLIAAFIITLITIRKSRKNPINVIFSLITFFLAVWIITTLLADTSNKVNLALFFGRLTVLGPIFIPYLLLLFSNYFPYLDKKFSKKYLFILVIPVILFLPFIFTKHNIKEVIIRPWGAETIPGKMYIFFVIYFIVYFVVALRNLFIKFKHSTGFYKEQIRYLFLGISLTAFISILTNAILPLFGIIFLSILGPPSTIFFIAFTTYAIVKYRLMDIRLVISRSLLYAILVSFVTGLFTLLTYFTATVFKDVIGTSALLTTFAVSLFIVLTLEPLKRYIGKNTDKVFFKARIDYQYVLRKLSQIISLEINLKNLIDSVTQALVKELKLKNALLFLPNKTSGGFTSFQDHGEKGQVFRIKNNHPLLSYLKKYRDLVVFEELEREITDLPESPEKRRQEVIKDQLQELKASLCVPVFVEGEMKSILMLGEKLSGDIFNKDDLGLCEVFAPQLGTALEKARLYQEVKDFNIKLGDEVKKATSDLSVANEQLKSANVKLRELDEAKSEFMSIASHQLRTPLSGIMGYLSMMQEGDFGKMSPEQFKVILDVLEASRRLIRMVNLFLNVTRIEAGRFKLALEKVDLAQLIQAEIKELKPTANKKNLKLEFKKPEQKIPLVSLDQDKMKDVILNLVDNAIKYTEKGGITVFLEKKDNKVLVSIKDTGVGIKPQDAEKLFSKFVRGSGISRLSPDGSGLGLFIARKITEAHGGKIWAESKGEGLGSTFRFELPVR